MALPHERNRAGRTDGEREVNRRSRSRASRGPDCHRRRPRARASWMLGHHNAATPRDPRRERVSLPVDRHLRTVPLRSRAGERHSRLPSSGHGRPIARLHHVRRSVRRIHVPDRRSRTRRRGGNPRLCLADTAAQRLRARPYVRRSRPVGRNDHRIPVGPDSVEPQRPVGGDVRICGTECRSQHNRPAGRGAARGKAQRTRDDAQCDQHDPQDHRSSHAQTVLVLQGGRALTAARYQCARSQPLDPRV